MVQDVVKLAPVGSVAKDCLSQQVGRIVRYKATGAESTYAVLANGVDHWDAPIGEVVILSGRGAVA